LGEKVAVVAVAQDPDNPPTLENITEFLRERGIAVFKLPEYLLLTTALPRNPLGKVLRHELSALVEAQRSH
jgi:non-ribosomal peptide synthetase component E (peptide arylation enzyme)